MDQPMVTITLDEYNKLRDEANDKIMLLDKINGINNQMMDISKRVYDLETKRA